MLTALKRLRWLFLLPLLTLLVGTIGFMIIENLSFIDALYFTIVTISTVGYGDISPATTTGRVFGIVLIVIGIGTFLTLITNVTQLLVARGRERLRRQRLNMLIGLFFTEIGNELLQILVKFDPNIDAHRQDFLIDYSWSAEEYEKLSKKIRNRDYMIDPQLIDLKVLKHLLLEKGDLLVRQIENPDLMEQESFAKLLWATVHLRDELLSRNVLTNLPEADINHLANDATRAYNFLVHQWLDYLRYLKQKYPYLFSLALRTNPFNEEASVIIT